MSDLLTTTTLTTITPMSPPPQPFTLDKALPILHLRVAYEGLFVHRYARGAAVPAGIWADPGFVSVTSTAEEVSIVAKKQDGSEHSGGPWAALRVVGPLEHRECGSECE